MAVKPLLPIEGSQKMGHHEFVTGDGQNSETGGIIKCCGLDFLRVDRGVGWGGEPDA